MSIRRRSTIICGSTSLPRGGRQDLGLAAEPYLELALVLVGHGSERFQKRAHLTPFDVRARVAERAYEISQSDEAEGDLDNWLRAEREIGGDPADSEV